jgi:hypothetical protein
MKAVYVVRSLAILERAVTFARLNWEAMSQTKHPLVIEFKPESTKRNLQQNKLYWAILRQIEEQCWVEGKQYSSEVWHEASKRRFIGCVDLPGGGGMAMSSADLSTAEFAEYVTRVEVWAQTELGVSLVDMAEPPARYGGQA